jgi:hypothetical protein
VDGEVVVRHFQHIQINFSRHTGSVAWRLRRSPIGG